MDRRYAHTRVALPRPASHKYCAPLSLFPCWLVSSSSFHRCQVSQTVDARKSGEHDCLHERRLSKLDAHKRQPSHRNCRATRQPQFIDRKARWRRCNRLHEQNGAAIVHRIQRNPRLLLRWTQQVPKLWIGRASIRRDFKAPECRGRLMARAATNDLYVRGVWP